MATQTNTTKSVKQADKLAMTNKQIDETVKKAGAALAKEKKVSVTIPKFLEKRLGSVVPVGINGAVIYIKVGEKVEIPESYKAQLDASLESLT